MKHKMAAWLRALLSVTVLAGLISSGGLVTLVGSDPARAGLAVLEEVPPEFRVFLPAVLKPAEPTPAPPPPLPDTIQVFDAQGAERDLDWLQEKYGEFVIQPAADGDGPAYRIAALRERMDADAVIRVSVLDEAGAPLAGIPVAWYWSGAPVDGGCGPLGGVLDGMVPDRCEHPATGDDGLTHFFMGPGAAYSPELGETGPHAVWVYGATTRSDLILGLGTLAGTAYSRFDVEYRRVGDSPSTCGGPWDPRLDELGVYLEPAVESAGEGHWCLYEARWADEAQAAGLHHIYLEAVDPEGSRVLGQAMVVEWPGGSDTVFIEDKPPPEYGANVAMYETLGSYSARVGGGQPSDRVVGMGLGTPEKPDFTIHTCFYLTFKWVP